MDFTERFLEDRNSIADTTEQSIVTAEGVWYCILVKEEGKREGILVHSSGYNYPRYTAIYREN